MPIKSDTQATPNGTMETVQVMLLSEAAEAFTESTLEDAIVIVIPDTGKAQFNPSHTQKKDETKTTKATFVVAELGGSYAGVSIPYRQSQGDVKGLPLSVKLSIVAQPPNRDAKSVDEALNRKPQSETPQESSESGDKPNLELLKTGTDN